MLDDDPIERWESRNDGKRIPAFKEPKTFFKSSYRSRVEELNGD